MDISSLEKDVQRYFEHGLAASTRRTYQAGINRFILFCNTYHICHPLPVTQSLLCFYVSHLANAGLSYSSIKTYLSTVRYLQVANGLPEPRASSMPKLDLVERGIRRVKSLQPGGRPRLPITPSILRQLCYCYVVIGCVYLLLCACIVVEWMWKSKFAWREGVPCLATPSVEGLGLGTPLCTLQAKWSLYTKPG